MNACAWTTEDEKRFVDNLYRLKPALLRPYYQAIQSRVKWDHMNPAAVMIYTDDVIKQAIDA